jgi:hypothetical protein
MFCRPQVGFNMPIDKSFTIEEDNAKDISTKIRGI